MAARGILSGSKVRLLSASDLGVPSGAPSNTKEPVATNPKTLAPALGVAEAVLNGWLDAIRRKRQAIFFGPPGTGKTYLATRIANFLSSQGDGFTETVQFHPSFAYEDFVEGRKPEIDGEGRLGYPVVAGRFRDFCERSAKRQGPCVLVIDEINRANLSQVLGELLYLLEYRDTSLVLPNSGRAFSIPANVILLGTMNSADRSIAVADLALRRRFAFLRVDPDMELLKQYHAKISGQNVDRLVEVLREVNSAIEDPNLALGQSYFMVPDLETSLESIWKTEVEPFLEEIFTDAPDRITQFRWERVADRVRP